MTNPFDNEEIDIEQLLPKFSDKMTMRERICAIAWLPIHIFVVPVLAFALMEGGYVTEAGENFLVYAIGAVYMLVVCYGFLRKNFDPLCDRLLYCIVIAVRCYFLMMVCNMLVSLLVSGVEKLAGNSGAVLNRNNEALMSIAAADYNITAAVTIFLAPIAEEVMFRGGIFGGIRAHSRKWAYIISTVIFAVYHVWAYALADPLYWVYAIQYIPAGILLCRAYEKTDSIWTGIFFHMMVNAMSIRALSILQQAL